MFERDQSEVTTAPGLRAGSLVRHSVAAVWRRTPLVFIALLAVSLCSFVMLLYLSIRLETATATPTEGQARVKAISQQIEVLQRKLGVLLAESVEMRLNALQRKIETGMVTSADIATFEQLKDDLTLLQGYTEAGDTNLVNGTSVEHVRFQSSPGSRVARNEELIDEILHVKSLLYFCAASLATTTVLISGYWLRQWSRLYRIQSGIAGVPMLEKGPNSESSDGHAV